MMTINEKSGEFEIALCILRYSPDEKMSIWINRHCIMDNEPYFVIFVHNSVNDFFAGNCRQCRIRMDKPEYIETEGDNKLSKDEIDKMISLLLDIRQPEKYNGNCAILNKSFWINLLSMYNYEHGLKVSDKYYLPLDYPMPDYTLLCK